MQGIVISESMDAPAVALLAREFDVDYRPALFDDEAALARALARADAWIVRNRTQVRGAPLAAAGRLRVVGRLGVGLDNIDLEACRARRIEVIPATGANAESVAEYVVAMSMVLLRGGAYLSTSAVAAGRWPRQMLSQGREVAGKTIGLVGFGSIGRVDGPEGARDGNARSRLRPGGARRFARLGRARRGAARARRPARRLGRRVAAPAARRRHARAHRGSAHRPDEAGRHPRELRPRRHRRRGGAGEGPAPRGASPAPRWTSSSASPWPRAACWPTRPTSSSRPTSPG